jgi:hypothetical protein
MESPQIDFFSQPIDETTLVIITMYLKNCFSVGKLRAIRFRNIYLRSDMGKSGDNNDLLDEKFNKIIGSNNKIREKYWNKLGNYLNSIFKKKTYLEIRDFILYLTMSGYYGDSNGKIGMKCANLILNHIDKRIEIKKMEIKNDLRIMAYNYQNIRSEK